MIFRDSRMSLRRLALAGGCGVAIAIAGCTPSSEDRTSATPDTTSAPPEDRATRALRPVPDVGGHEDGMPVLDPGVDLAEAVAFESPLGYTILVPPSFAMTQEEPCCDQAYVRGSGTHFMRIERIRPDAALAGLEEDTALALSAVGQAESFAHPALEGHDIESALRAHAPRLSATTLITRVGEGRYRITRHVPREGAAEAVEAEMRAMLASMQTTGPWEAP